jgi:hypothetical protein
MNRDRPSPLAGGFLLAFSVIAGAVIGTLYRQPSIGVLAGLGVGLALLGLVWLIDRKRR